ncbi:hypothetical protein BV898_20107 [Hypsibius exemplaris]|uniref:Receptor ligand binding region domain-containing protein n=1 Tax=Hypsibius exemplaris TaxID=2072580 RepID=A0A9X6NT75_HYPEX|nr:hypothetical protein BV898_20107 [Hypsibius exemplaris]
MWFFYLFFVTITAAVVRSLPGRETRNIVIVVALPYRVGSPTDVVLTGPAFDLAAEAVNNRRRGSGLQVTIDYLYRGSDRTDCDEISYTTTGRMAEYNFRETSNGNTMRQLVCCRL